MMKTDFYIALIFVSVITTAKQQSVQSDETLISLPNEDCKPRKTIVAVDPQYKYNPYMISLYRCDGSVDGFSPAQKRCVAATVERLHLRVVGNILSPAHGHYPVVNHTSCKGVCVYDKSVCSENQSWNSTTCKCICSNGISRKCPENFQWNQNLCQCVCVNFCNDRQEFNETDCSCTCKSRYYKRCQRKGGLSLDEKTCRSCFSPQTQFGLSNCNIIPTKWAAIIIILSFCAFFILIFDCILYGRSTGCIFHATHICQKPMKEEHIPIKNAHRSQFSESCA